MGRLPGQHVGGAVFIDGRLHFVYCRLNPRRALRGYTAELLNVLIGCSALCAGSIYVAYCLSRSDWMPFVLTAVPALLGLLSYLKLAWRSTSVETPEYLLLRSRSLLISLGGWLALVGWFTAIR